MYDETLNKAAEAQQSARDKFSRNECGATMGLAGIGPMRTTLRDRIRDQRIRAEAEGTRAAQLGELEYLLDKNPDFARILDLLEVVRG